VQDVFNLLPNLNVHELVKSFAGEFLIHGITTRCHFSWHYTLLPSLKTACFLLGALVYS